MNEYYNEIRIMINATGHLLYYYIYYSLYIILVDQQFYKVFYNLKRNYSHRILTNYLFKFHVQFEPTKQFFMSNVFLTLIHHDEYFRIFKCIDRATATECFLDVIQTRNTKKKKIFEFTVYFCNIHFLCSRRKLFARIILFLNASNSRNDLCISVRRG